MHALRVCTGAKGGCSCQRECVERGGSGSKIRSSRSVHVSGHKPYFVCPTVYKACCWLASHQSIHCLCLKPRLMPRGIPHCTESSQTKPNAGGALANDRPAPHLLISRCSHTLADDAARAATASVELSVVPAVRLGGGPCARRGWMPGDRKPGKCAEDPRIRAL